MTYVGVAGWDYPDWAGIAYPATAHRGFDRLSWLARFVDVVEINSTFYRPASPKTAESWAKRGAKRSGFRFTAKAHRAWTHEPWDDAAAVVRPTFEGLAPLRASGLLGALLVQFPQSFHWTETNRGRVGRLVDAASGWPVVVETRHVSWDDDAAAAWIHRLGAGWCVVDQPRMSSTAPPRPRVTSEVGYLRLHGRNAANWFAEDAGRDARYDYLYAESELGPLAETARGMSRSAHAVYAIANNHFRGQALANALQLKHLIQGVVPEVPPELVAAYPGLAAITKTAHDRLF
ncbi:MAG TPA: DUF72 domain-containing protein [Candidatus Polarisedimenticolaceae bacterium]|nr:DUF72 domain-containing protein [Candidatus Polarisedimenticolaceae bacterium]